MAIEQPFEGLPPDNIPFSEQPNKRRFRFDEQKRAEMQKRGVSEDQIRIEEDIIANRITANLDENPDQQRAA